MWGIVTRSILKSSAGCLLRAAAIAVVTIALLEAGTWLLFRPLVGVPYAPDDLERARRERIALIDARLGGTYDKDEQDGSSGTEDKDGTGGTIDTDGGALYDFHPYLGYVGHPGARPWKSVEAGYNDFGLFSYTGHPYPYVRKPGDFVVGVLGGSVAEIFANTMEADLQAALVEADPELADRNVVMLSLASGGYKQPQQLFVLEYLLLQGFEFDLVLNIDGFNDLALAVDNRTHGINPLFPSGAHFGPLSASLRANPKPEVIRNLAAVLTAYDRERRVLRAIDAAPLRYSVFLNALGARFSRFSENRIGQLQYALAQTAQTEMDPAFRGPPPPDADDTAAAAAAVWRAASEMIDAVCRERGMPYVHVLQPNQYVPGSKPLTEHEVEIAIERDHPWGKAAREGYGRLIEEGERLSAEGVAFYDMTQIFAGVAEELYVDNCCHFNHTGNRILAREIARAIVATVRGADGEAERAAP